jgi:hypothetical protein
MLTETDLMKAAYNQVFGDYRGVFTANEDPMLMVESKEIKVMVIDSPGKYDQELGYIRPTTESNITGLCDVINKLPELKDRSLKVIFVSQNPYIGYQEAVIRAVLRNEAVNIDLEVVGPESRITSMQGVINATRELGAQLFAQTPSVLIKNNIKTSDPKQFEALKELYKNKPLIFQNVDALLAK